MVALATPSLNESYVEPSPYAWLRTRAPVPTTYAPACDPLYPFQEILENRTSRARGMTDNCAEVPSRKCLICIEMWQFELESCVWRVSFHKYAYVHGDPIQGIDPTGQFGVLIGIGISMMMAGPGDYIKGGLEALVKAYVVNLEWDVKWALDMSMPDDWGSRLDDKWVYAALGQGLHDQFNIDTPFGTFNPLDLFGGGSDASFASASRASNGGRFNSPNVRVGRSNAGFSEQVTRVTAKGIVHKINLYLHPKFGKLAIFPDTAIKHQVKITPTGSQLEDCRAANRKLGKDPDYRWESEFGEKYTWHHDTRKGIMQLVPSKIHNVAEGGVPHVGGNKIWYSV